MALTEGLRDELLVGVPALCLIVGGGTYFGIGRAPEVAHWLSQRGFVILGMEGFLATGSQSLHLPTSSRTSPASMTRSLIAQECSVSLRPNCSKIGVAKFSLSSSSSSSVNKLRRVLAAGLQDRGGHHHPLRLGPLRRTAAPAQGGVDEPCLWAGGASPRANRRRRPRHLLPPGPARQHPAAHRCRRGGRRQLQLRPYGKPAGSNGMAVNPLGYAGEYTDAETAGIPTGPLPPGVDRTVPNPRPAHRP